MENQKLHQNTLTSIFKKITSEEKKIALQHEIDLFNAYIVLNKTILKLVEKRLVGRPQKYVAKILLYQEIKQKARGKASEEASGEVGEGQHTRIGNQQKRRGECTNWFVLDLWPPIMATINKHGNNYQALHFLKTTYRKSRVSSPYDKLRKASLWD